MAVRRSVVFNGDLGSGKTTVSKLLAARLGIRRISVGDLYRDMAAQRGMTALQLNLHAELDDKIDHYVDQLQSDIADAGEHLVVDSRLAWHFFAGALKVHLIAEPTIAARRVLDSRADAVENYASVEEARERLASRSESERIRFLTRYGADKTRLRNYDLVCDSTSASPEQIVERILDRIRTVEQAGPADPTPAPICNLDPTRIFPTADADAPTSGRHTADEATLEVGHAPPHFFAVAGHRRLAAAIRACQPLVAATLAAEATEPIAGLDCASYLHANATPERIRGWEHAHGIRLPTR
jgi:predicted cytidylate kinase